MVREPPPPSEPKDSLFSTVCSVLPCMNHGDIRMNSMYFCWDHRGLALANGLRHKCNMCAIFSILCIKWTGHDEAHQHNYMRRLTVPVIGSNGWNNFNAHIKTYCNDEFDPKTQQMIYVSQFGTHKYWEEFEYRMVNVPENSFAYVWPGTRSVTAWVHVETLKNGEWVPLGEREKFMLDNILREESPVYENQHGTALPCAPNGQWLSYPTLKSVLKKRQHKCKTRKIRKTKMGLK